MKRVKGDQIGSSKKNVQLMSLELVPLCVVSDAMNDDEEIVSIVVNLGMLRFVPAVFYRQWMKAEQAIEYVRFFRRRCLKIDPEKAAIFGSTQEWQRREFPRIRWQESIEIW